MTSEVFAKAPQTLRRLKEAVESYKRRGYIEYSGYCQDAVDLIETLIAQSASHVEAQIRTIALNVLNRFMFDQRTPTLYAEINSALMSELTDLNVYDYCVTCDEFTNSEPVVAANLVKAIVAYKLTENDQFKIVVCTLSLAPAQRRGTSSGGPG